jgi:hypothetical protein
VNPATESSTFQLLEQLLLYSRTVNEVEKHQLVFDATRRKLMLRNRCVVVNVKKPRPNTSQSLGLNKRLEKRTLAEVDIAVCFVIRRGATNSSMYDNSVFSCL